MLTKVNEYAIDSTSKWPHSLSVGDVLRATLVCVHGDSLHEAWVRLSSPAGFDLRPGNGRLKNLMATTEARPPCMLVNVIVDSDGGGRPVLAEVQIELLGIIRLAMAEHKYYEIRRASTTRQITGDHTPFVGVTAAKQIGKNGLKNWLNTVRGAKSDANAASKAAVPFDEEEEETGIRSRAQTEIASPPPVDVVREVESTSIETLGV